MYRMSTANYLVIRMRCGNGDTVGRKWGNGKGLQEDWALKKFWKSAGRSKTVPLRPKGTAPELVQAVCVCATRRSNGSRGASPIASID